MYSVNKLIAQARKIAADYRRATGKTLGGVSGEIAENDAARLLNLELCQEKQGGYDAIGKGKRDGLKIQIKGRAIFDESKSNQRIGQLKIDQTWDSILLVLMDADFEPVEIYEAHRDAVMAAIEQNKSSNRMKRGAMSVAKFKNIASLVWVAGEGEIDNEIWENH